MEEISTLLLKETWTHLLALSFDEKESVIR